MRRFLIALAAGFLAAPVLANDRAVLGEMTLVVQSERDACRLIALSETGDQILRLGMSGLCRFHRTPDGDLRSVDSPLGPVVLVETSAPMPDGSGDCRTSVQAVRLTDAGAEAAPSPALVASCLPFQWDEVMFLGVF